MPKAVKVRNPRASHFCRICGKGPYVQQDLLRHISCSKDSEHQALRSAVHRGTLQPAHVPLPPPIVETQDDEWVDEPEELTPRDHLMPDMMEVDGDIDPPETLNGTLEDQAHRAAVESADSNEPFRRVFESAGARLRRVQSPHAAFAAARDKSGSAFYPFNCQLDYDFAHWLIAESISNAAFERLMKIDSVRSKLGLSFTTARALKKILDKIPTKAPWVKRTISIKGLKRKFDVLYRDPKLLLQDIWSRPNLEGRIALRPEQRYTDKTREVRIYNDFNTGNWMWRMQRKLRRGATVVPITLFQDKTQLCQLIGVESNMAYPMYLTISTIDGQLQRDVSSRVHAMAALLPVVNLKGLGLSKARQKTLSHRITHQAMRVTLQSLYEPSHLGMELTSASGDVHEGYPILTMEGLDYPEQCLHTACRRCPKCDTKRSQFSDNTIGNARTPEETLHHIRHAATLGSVSGIDTYLKNHGLNYVLEPFWKDWAHVNVHGAIAPDILHQLYQGLVKHLTAWCRAIIGDEEMDARMSRMPKAFGLRHFENGISCLQRVSGTEHRAISKVLLCGMATADVDKRLTRAIGSLLNYTFMVQYRSHSDETLEDTQEVLDRFHENKDVLIDLGACKDFNFPKIHMLGHYIPSIKEFGSLLPISTDIGERLHIDNLKNAYQATNKKRREYPKQMCAIRTKEDKMDWLGHFLAHANGTTFDSRKRIDSKQHDPVEFADKPAVQRKITDISRLHIASGIDSALELFLRTYIDAEWDRLGQPQPAPAIPWIGPYQKIPVWYCMKFFTPDLQTPEAKDTRDVAYAVPRRTRRDLDRDDDDDLLEAHFSPVFVKEGGELAGEGGTDGLRVGHLRVIFELPPNAIQYLKDAGIDPPGKLAFVQWFTNLGRRDTDTGMFKVSAQEIFARGQGAQRVRAASIIEAIDIRRTAYLYPRLGHDTPAIPRALTSENILEEWKGEFWVDHHFDLATFRSLL